MVSSVIPPSHTKEAFVGMQLETTRQVLSQDVINDYIQRTGDTHPWYTGESPFGKPLVPAMLTYNWPGQPNSTWYPENIYGNLHARHEFEWYQPAFAGDSLVGHRVIVDRYEKRDEVWRIAYRSELVDWVRDDPAADTWFKNSPMILGARKPKDPLYDREKMRKTS